MIFQVPYWDIPNVWPKAAHHLQKALERQTEWDLPSVYDALLKQGFQLWIAPWDVAVVTQIQTFPCARICMLVLCGGQNLGRHKDGLEQIENWAKSLGCTEMRLSGRRGWERVYPGYEPITITMRKSL